MADGKGKDLYAILGVERDVGADGLRRAYRKLARKFHPDVNPGNKQAEERFKEISAAYDVLSNPEKRKLYDEFGLEGLRGGFDPARAREYQKWQEQREATGFGSGAETGFDFDLGDIFGDIFGGAATRARGPAVGQDTTVQVEIDLPLALHGGELDLKIPTRRTCEVCHGSGEQPGARATTCPECGGTGKRQAVRGPMRLMSACPTCGGKGRIATPCSACGGEGTISTVEQVTVRIPKGVDNGTRLRVPGRGLVDAAGGQPGDLVIETRVRPHPYFTRTGMDLHLRLPVTLEEAYSGAQVDVPTPTGSVRLRVPPLSQQGRELRLRGKGVERGHERGDLYVTLDVRLPETGDERLKEAFAAANRAYAKPVREGIRL